jgi:chitin disaccharide deacetylase
MLIVNADDLGRHRGATDSALLCCAKKCVSSVSAMVFMEDSERAAELALDSGIGVGLHLNLSERFSADRVPPRLLNGAVRSEFLGVRSWNDDHN